MRFYCILHVFSFYMGKDIRRNVPGSFCLQLELGAARAQLIIVIRAELTIFLRKGGVSTLVELFDIIMLHLCNLRIKA